MFIICNKYNTYMRGFQFLHNAWTAPSSESNHITIVLWSSDAIPGRQLARKGKIFRFWDFLYYIHSVRLHGHLS